MPRERTQLERMRTELALVAGGISLLLALIVGWPMYSEVATRSAFLAGELRQVSATAVTEDDGDYDYRRPVNRPPPEFAVVLSDGTRYDGLAVHGLAPGNGETVRVGMLGDDLGSVNGRDIRGVTGEFSFGYFVLLAVLTGTTVLTTAMVISRRSQLPYYRLSTFAWSAGLGFIPVALFFDMGLGSAWWPVIGWGGNVALFVSIYTFRYRRTLRTLRQAGLV